MSASTNLNKFCLSFQARGHISQKMMWQDLIPSLYFFRTAINHVTVKYQTKQCRGLNTLPYLHRLSDSADVLITPKICLSRYPNTHYFCSHLLMATVYPRIWNPLPKQSRHTKFQFSAPLYTISFLYPLNI